MKTFKELFEKKLTPAELKKREEIAKAMERENPGMDMGKKMAIATAAAKRVAEEVELDELSTDTLKSYHKKAVDKLVKGDVPLDKYKKREAGAMKAFNKAYMEETEVEEANMSSDRSKQMFKRNELDHELRHEVEPKRAEPADPHAVHINGKKWKTFPTKSHATNVAKKIAGASVVKESIDEGKIPEMRYSEVMKKIKSGTHEATHDVKPGKHVELRHIDSGKKTTVYVKESSELDEATDHHADAMEHKKQSDAAMDKNDMEAYHHHMSAHHESMGQWHESKGRSSNADKEYEKAEKHHELSLKKSNQKNEGTNMLSFKYFQEVLEEAKKNCKESSSELENAHDMKDMEDELDDEEDEKEIEEQAPVAPVPGTKSKTHAIMVHPESKQRVTIPRKNVKNYPASEGWKEVAPGMKESVEELEELSKDTLSSYASKAGKRLGGNIASLSKAKEISKMSANPTSPEEVKDRLSKGIAKRTSGLAGAAKRLTSEEVEELDEAITHVVAKGKLAAHKEFMDKEGFDVTTKPLPKSHPKHATHVGIVSKNSQESSYHEDGHAISESVELDERNKENAMKRKSMDASRGSRFKLQGNPVPEPEAGHKTAQAHNKAIGRAIRQMTREEVELEEALKGDLHPDAGKVLKHIKPEHHDKYKPYLKNGVYKGNYADRSAVLRAAEKAKHTVDEAVSPFDWKAYAKERGTAAGEKTKTFHDVKKTSTGTVYTKQVNPDGMSKGSGDDAAKEVEKAEAPKRGRGRPAGVGAKTGSYKPRDPEKKAASAAKAAASKAANRAMRKESFDEEFMESLIEGFEDEDFDDFLYCEEFDELDEATKEALLNFINEKCASKMKESLTGNQHKLDKNKNGKIDSHDFKLLRKEETEQLKESVTSYAAFLNKK
jgi:hypothetical protein